MTTVRDLTSPVTATIELGQDLRHAARAMVADEVGLLLVVSRVGHPVGVLSERDLVRALGEGVDPDGEWLGDHMTDQLVVVAGSTDPYEALTEMLDAGVRHLVVDGDRVVSQRRLVEHLRGHDVAVA